MNNITLAMMKTLETFAESGGKISTNNYNPLTINLSPSGLYEYHKETSGTLVEVIYINANMWDGGFTLSWDNNATFWIN